MSQKLYCRWVLGVVGLLLCVAQVRGQDVPESMAGAVPLVDPLRFRN